MVAQALVITEKTAGHHVEHIGAKAGVASRVGRMPACFAACTHQAVLAR